MYYYTDAEELLALRKENEQLKIKIEELEKTIKELKNGKERKIKN